MAGNINDILRSLNTITQTKTKKVNVNSILSKIKMEMGKIKVPKRTPGAISNAQLAERSRLLKEQLARLKTLLHELLGKLSKKKKDKALSDKIQAVLDEVDVAEAARNRSPRDHTPPTPDELAALDPTNRIPSPPRLDDLPQLSNVERLIAQLEIAEFERQVRDGKTPSPGTSSSSSDENYAPLKLTHADNNHIESPYLELDACGINTDIQKQVRAKADALKLRVFNAKENLIKPAPTSSRMAPLNVRAPIAPPRQRAMSNMLRSFEPLTNRTTTDNEISTSVSRKHGW